MKLGTHSGGSESIRSGEQVGEAWGSRRIPGQGWPVSGLVYRPPLPHPLPRMTVPLGHALLSAALHSAGISPLQRNHWLSESV